MRHFAAHGRAGSPDNPPYFNYDILGEMPPILAKGMQAYLSALEVSDELCACLAKARVEPYRTRPIFEVLWSCHQGPTAFPVSVSEAISQFDWTYKDRVLERLWQEQQADRDIDLETWLANREGQGS